MASLQRYTDRRVLVTGGGSGIGQATVLRILDEGGLVAAADISESGLKDTVARAEPHGDRLSTVVIDVADEASVKEGVAAAVEVLGGLDALVNAEPRPARVTFAVDGAANKTMLVNGRFTSTGGDIH